MPVYNGGPFLAKAIESILNQTFTDFELLLINDGSTDSSESIIQSFNDTRIRYVSHAQNKGLVFTLNEGIDLASGEFIARMDGDDISLPSRLEKELNYFDSHPNVCLVSTHFMRIDQHGKEIGYSTWDLSTITYEQMAAAMAIDNCIAHPTVMGRKTVFQKYRYKPSQKQAEDWDLWMRMFSAKEQIAKLPEVLLLYRVHTGSIMGKQNAQSVYLKKFLIQSRYCLDKLRTIQLNAFDRSILKGAVANGFKHLFYTIHPMALSSLRQILTTNPFALTRQYHQLKRKTNNAVQAHTKLYFFFSFYHSGNAEQLHARILEAVSDSKPMVFFTEKSSGKGLYESFCKYATVVEINLINGYPLIHRLAKKLLAKQLSQIPGALAFGSNTSFFYQTLPFFRKDVICMDLIHHLSYPAEGGPEYSSLPVIALLKKRVVTTQQTKEDFICFYSDNQVPTEMLDRILLILPPDLIQEDQERSNKEVAFKRAYQKLVEVIS
jgi:glycosyltransferase involved in cell wall biosynthesis